ncbi:hypothetical protein Emag_002154 [Eimeria magna]
MGGAESTIQFGGASGAPQGFRGFQGPLDKREEEGALPGSPSPRRAARSRGPRGLWQQQDGDKTLDAVMQTLRNLKGGECFYGAPSGPPSRPPATCLLQQQQLLVAWRMSRRGAPGRCGCCETLLPLGGPLVKCTLPPDAAESETRLPPTATSSSSTGAAADVGGARAAKPPSEVYRRAGGVEVSPPDPTSCYVILHAYTAANQEQQQQQQQAASHTPQGPVERRRSLSPADFSRGAPSESSSPRFRGAFDRRVPHSRSSSSSSSSNCSSSSSNTPSALHFSKDLLRLLSQADSLIAGDTRRHSVWHAVQRCCCRCFESQQQQQPHQQQQQQQQHLWALYLWEGVEAPRYILDHARLRTLRLVEALEGCEKRGVPLSPAALLAWGALAQVKISAGAPLGAPSQSEPQGEGPGQGEGSPQGAPQEEREFMKTEDVGALLSRNVLLLRLLQRPPRLSAVGGPRNPSPAGGAAVAVAAAVPASAAAAVSAAQTAASIATTPLAAAAATVAAAAAAASGLPASVAKGDSPVGRDAATSVAGASRLQQQQDEQQQGEQQQEQQQQQRPQQQPRSPLGLPRVPRLSLGSEELTRLKLQQQQQQQHQSEGLPQRSSSGSGAALSSRASPLRSSLAASSRDSDSSWHSSSASPLSSAPVSPTGAASSPQDAVVGGPPLVGGFRAQGGLKLHGVPKLAIPVLGGRGPPSPPAAAATAAATAADRRHPRSTQTRGLQKQGSSSPRGFRPGAPRRFEETGGGRPPPLFREGAPSLPLLPQQQQQQQQQVLLLHSSSASGTPLGTVSSRGFSGASASPVGSPGGPQRSDDSSASRDLQGLRRRRTDDVSRSSSRCCCCCGGKAALATILGVQRQRQQQQVSSLHAPGGLPLHLPKAAGAAAATAAGYSGFHVAALFEVSLQDGVNLYSRTRQQQLMEFRAVLSDVYCGRLFVAGAVAACDCKDLLVLLLLLLLLQRLENAGITHIVNSIGDICPALFPDRFVYKTYYLKDTRSQDIMSVFYDCIRFISEAIDTSNNSSSSSSSNSSSSSSGGSTSGRQQHRVLIHCKEGVSRSATLAIAFLMWKLQLPFAEAFEYVRFLPLAPQQQQQQQQQEQQQEKQRQRQCLRRRRAICSPNTGFTFQLLLLQKRLRLFSRPRGGLLPDGDAEAREGPLSPPPLGAPPALSRAPLLKGLPPSGLSGPAETAGKGLKRAGGAAPDGNFPLGGPPCLSAVEGGPSAPKTPRSASSGTEGGPSPRFSQAILSSVSGFGGGGASKPPGPRAPRLCAPVRPDGDTGDGEEDRPSPTAAAAAATTGATGVSSDASSLVDAASPRDLQHQQQHHHQQQEQPQRQQQGSDGAIAEGPASSRVAPATAAAAPAAGGSSATMTAAAAAAAEDDCVLLLRLVVHSPRAPDFLLWSELTHWKPGAPPSFSEKGAYLLRGGPRAWLWRDSSKCLRSSADVEAAARDYQANVALVEGRDLRIDFIFAGEEPVEFWGALGLGPPYPSPLGAPNVLSGVSKREIARVQPLLQLLQLSVLLLSLLLLQLLLLLLLLLYNCLLPLRELLQLEPTTPEEPEEVFRLSDYPELVALSSPTKRRASVSAEGGPFGGPHTGVLGALARGPLDAAAARRDACSPTSSQPSSSRRTPAAASLRRSFELGQPAAAAAGGTSESAAAATTPGKATAKLFCLPDLQEPLDLFDSEDLLSDGVFLLIAEGDRNSSSNSSSNSSAAAAAAAVAATRAWLWIGSKAAFDKEEGVDEVKRQIQQVYGIDAEHLQLSMVTPLFPPVALR